MIQILKDTAEEISPEKQELLKFFRDDDRFIEIQPHQFPVMRDANSWSELDVREYVKDAKNLTFIVVLSEYIRKKFNDKINLMPKVVIIGNATKSAKFGIKNNGGYTPLNFKGGTFQLCSNEYGEILKKNLQKDMKVHLMKDFGVYETAKYLFIKIFIKPIFYKSTNKKNI